MASAADLMAPYFRRIAQAVSIDAGRNGKLQGTVFDKKLWSLSARSALAACTRVIVARPHGKEIDVSYAGLAMLWCLSVYAVLTREDLRRAKGQPDAASDVGTFGTAQDYLDHATRLRDDDESWPADLAAPDEGQVGEPFETIDRIVYGAASWILLREIAYAFPQHKHELLRPWPTGELVDGFAARWMFRTDQSGEEREFRILAVGVGLAWLLLFEPTGGGAGRPTWIARIMDVYVQFEEQRDSVALAVVARLLKDLFFPTVATPQFETSQDLFDWAIRLFR